MDNYIPDYIDLHREYEARQYRELRKRPVCDDCEEPIQDEECFAICGKLICPGCLKDNYRKRTDDYDE